MNEFAYKLGLRLLQIRYIRQAVDERANLNAFRKRPTFRIFLGVFAIAFSFLMCWPAISALGALAIYWRMPLLLVIGGPTLYGLSHLCFLFGMALSGAEYSGIFMRWIIRRWVEHLLSRGFVPESNEIP